MFFHLLQSLFSSAPNAAGKFDPELVQAAIERVIDSTDPRLRMVRHYRKKLGPAIERSAEYIIQLVDALPDPIEITHRSFTKDPRLRALFASPQQVQEILSFGQELNRYRQRVGSGLPVDLYAVLRMERTEKTVLGMALEGNIIRRDVPQVMVSFHDHRVAFPTGSETKTRREIKKRAFSYLIETALERLVSVRTHKQQLEQQQRQLLQKKAMLLRGSQRAVDPPADPKTPTYDTPVAIDQRLHALEAELGRIRADSATLDQNLAQVVAILAEPENHLRLDPVSMTLDHMNVKVEAASSCNANTMRFDDVLLGQARRITALLIRFPSNEVLPQPDFFEEANKMLYLGSQARLTVI